MNLLQLIARWPAPRENPAVTIRKPMSAAREHYEKTEIGATRWISAPDNNLAAFQAVVMELRTKEAQGLIGVSVAKEESQTGNRYVTHVQYTRLA